MICLRVFRLKKVEGLRFISESLLINYSCVCELRTLQKYNNIEVKTELSFAPIESVLANLHELPQDEIFTWTHSRKEVAKIINLFLDLRQEKLKGVISQAVGINGVLLEGEAGLGKSRLCIELLKQRNIEYVIIDNSDNSTVDIRTQLLECFHLGKVAFIDEFNGGVVDEYFLNKILSTAGKRPGFGIICTQNPETYAGRVPLSKALRNRLWNVQVAEYEEYELLDILENKYGFDEQTRQTIVTDFLAAKQYAAEHKINPRPNTRHFFATADKIKAGKFDLAPVSLERKVVSRQVLVLKEPVIQEPVVQEPVVQKPVVQEPALKQTLSKEKKDIVLKIIRSIDNKITGLHWSLFPLFFRSYQPKRVLLLDLREKLINFTNSGVGESAAGIINTWNTVEAQAVYKRRRTRFFNPELPHAKTSTERLVEKIISIAASF